MNEIRSPRLLALLLLTFFATSMPTRAASSWRKISPEGASIQTLAAAPGSAGVVYSVTARGSFYSSSDGAGNWSSRQSPRLYLSELVVDPVRSEILYGVSFEGVVKSVDGGRSWSSPLFTGGVWTLSVAPSAPNNIYVSGFRAPGENTILKSTDGGATWVDTGFNEGGGAALAVDPTDARIVYSGDFRSDDGGTTWAEALSGPDDPRGGKAGIVKLVIDPRQPSTIYGGSFGQVFKSTDRGATWSLAWAGPESLAFLEALVIDPMSGAVFALFADSNGDEVFRSTDGGANWQPVFSRFRIQGMAVDGRLPGRLYVGTRAGGVYRSDDGGSSWVAANHGFRELGFTSVAADPHTPGVLFAVADANPFGILGLTPRIVFRSTDGGATWSSPFGNPESSPYVNEMASDPNQPGTWYLAHASGVLKTQDGGESWENASKGLRFPEFVYTITLAPSQPEKLYALGWDTFPLCEGTDCLKIIVYHSRDGAAQWQGASVPGLAPRFLLTSLAVDAASPSVVYAGGPALFKSSDGGVSWKKSGRGLGGGAFELVTDPSKPGALHAVVARANGHKVFLSRDGSETWEPASRGLPSGVLISKLTPDATTPGTVYAATSRGLYVTRNRGKLWTAMNDGLGDLPVWTVALDPLRPGVVYAGRPDGLFVFSEDPAGH